MAIDIVECICGRYWTGYKIRNIKIMNDIIKGPQCTAAAVNVRRIETCCPDYFQGSDIPYIQVPVYFGMTQAQFYKAAIDSFESDGMLGAAFDSLSDEFNDGLRNFLSPYTGAMDCTVIEFAESLSFQYIDPIELGGPEVYVYLALQIVAL